MNVKRISELMALLPEDAPYFRRLPVLSGGRKSKLQRAVERRAYCQNDPRFGWNYIRSFIEMEQKLPSMTLDPILYRVWFAETEDFHDPDVVMALALEQPQMTVWRNLLRCYLILPEFTFDQIGKELALPANVVKIYERLFFNVRDRLDDKVYITSICYPESRQVEFVHNYPAMEDVGLQMLRHTFTHGSMGLALVMAGMKSYLSDSDSEMNAKRLESLIMSNAVHLARTGGLNQSHAPGLSIATRVLSAIKVSGMEDKTSDDLVGLQAISAGQGVIETILAIQRPNHMMRAHFADTPPARLAEPAIPV